MKAICHITKLINTFPLGIWVLLLSINLTSCQDSSDRSFKETTRFLPKEELVGISPAFDPSILTEDEKYIFQELNQASQKTFAHLNDKQRAFFLTLLKEFSPNQAVWKAAETDVLELSESEQSLYFKLNPTDKLLFLALDDEPTKHTIEFAKNSSAAKALKQGALKEIALYPENYRKWMNLFTVQEMALFLTLTDKTQNQIIKQFKTKSIESVLEEGKKIDIQRLPKEQQVFIYELSPLEQTLFLILSPEKRGMSLFLTKKLDVNLAIEYAFFTRP